MEQQASIAPVVTDLDKLPALQLVWQWTHGLMLALGGASIFAALGWTLHRFNGSDYPLLGALLLPLGAIVGWMFGRARFRHYRAQLHAGEGVVVFDGVWWRSETWVPIVSLQHIDVNQGPLDRRWGMASLTLHTAGAHDHETRVAGLPLAQAQALRAALMPTVVDAHG
jgi:membrane protein YdbS with pleckstrin-like domain